jgi:hypothetical protein
MLLRNGKEIESKVIVPIEEVNYMDWFIGLFY